MVTCINPFMALYIQVRILLVLRGVGSEERDEGLKSCNAAVTAGTAESEGASPINL